jgi:hypothetical protein
MDWARILAYVTGTVDQELLARIEYLAAENRILKAQLKGRLKLSDAENKNGEVRDALLHQSDRGTPPFFEDGNHFELVRIPKSNTVARWGLNHLRRQGMPVV